MKILEGEEKQEFIRQQVGDLVSFINKMMPKTFSIRALDVEIVAALIAELARSFILARSDGRRLFLSYIPKE